ncbi:hypothetical protein CPT_Sonora_070 [Stenotrophomonas phage Sonora]|nr:hypothetical protein CPT_Sonora_070 [Stenotrophomonas phage Sonora]
MPLDLTSEEETFILKRRREKLEVEAFNQGLVAARNVVKNYFLAGMRGEAECREICRAIDTEQRFVS